MQRLQLLFAARGGCRDDLVTQLETEAKGVGATLLVQLDDDPFPAMQPTCRPFDAVLELEGDDAAALVDRVDGIAARLEPLVHADLSAALVGTPQRIIPCDPTPVRYLYVMRRKAGTTHEQYIDHYFNRHAEFGRITPGVVGYTQFHVDAGPSRDTAARLGLGVHAADSVSELHLNSLEEFLTAVATFERAMDASEDEDRFVDRVNSVMFTTATRSL